MRPVLVKEDRGWKRPSVYFLFLAVSIFSLTFSTGGYGFTPKFSYEQNGDVSKADFFNESLPGLETYTGQIRVYLKSTRKFIAPLSHALTTRIGDMARASEPADVSALLLQEKTRYQKLVFGLVIVTLLVVILTLFVFWMKKNNLTIQSQKDKLDSANEKLIQSEQLYRELFENSLALICTHTLDGKIINVNKAAESALKIPRELFAGRFIAESIPLQYKAEFEKYRKEIIEKGRSEGWLRVIDGRGQLRILRYQNRIVSGSGSEPYVIGFAQDQTEMFNAREEADRERKRLQSVMKNSPDIVSLLKPDGEITYVNRPVFFHDGKVVGRNLLEFIDGPVREVFARSLAMSLEDSTIVEFEVSLREKYFLTKMVPITRMFRVKEMLVILTDITELKRTEHELKNSKEKAEESNRLKTIFLGSLSHEVRTPLQGIMGMTELMELPSIDDSKKKEFVQIIKRRAVDMQNIIESLLDMASIETGEMRPFPVDMNLFEFIESTFLKLNLDSSLLNKRISFSLINELPPDARVHVDPQHAYQVLTNLFRNAVKFTPGGEILLKAYTEQDIYKMQIEDTGIGISEDKIDQIFEPFRQAHEGFSRSKGGIGLGLSICRKFVEMWGGSITVTSKLGIGSVFTISIPKKNKMEKLR